MKKIWSIRKDDEAVSPVIATILMVAITVVLAAVLYVMVLGIGGDTEGNIVISMNKDSTGTNNWTVSITSIAGTSQLATSDVWVMVKDATGAVGLTARVLSGMTTTVYYSGVSFNEAHTANYLNAGDFFLLNKTTYAVGSTIILTDSSGAQTYASFPI